MSFPPLPGGSRGERVRQRLRLRGVTGPGKFPPMMRIAGHLNLDKLPGYGDMNSDNDGKRIGIGNEHA